MDASLVVLGVHIRNVARQQALSLLEGTFNDRCEGPAASVFFVNANTLNLAASNPSYRDVLNAGNFVFADGTGVRWAAALQRVRLCDNLEGTTFIPNLLEHASGRGYSYFLLGADAPTINAAADYAQRAFPGWKQAGYHHGYLTDANVTSAAIEAINAARPDLLLVGMGNPLQEEWIHRNRSRLDVAVCAGVGGLFDFWAGNVTRAPLWLRRIGHEWLWRLYQQPRLKAHRYLVGNPLFLTRILREQFRPQRPR